MAHVFPDHNDLHRGITLMEVLIAIGVATIGLLGVAALIPVAAYQVQEGARNDRMANVGRRSIREVGARGYYHPGQFNAQSGIFNSRRWIGGIVPAGFRRRPNAFNDPDDVVFQYWSTNAQQHGKLIRRPYCIDPAFVAYKLTLNGNVDTERASALANNALRVLPRDDGELAALPLEFGSPPMARITLTADETLVNANTEAQMVSNVMGLAQAKDCFAFHDDLEFSIPDSKSAAPLQQMFTAGGLIIRRLAKNEFSWFMTVMPSGPSGSPWWTVSAVVIRDRNLTQPEIYGSLRGGVRPDANTPGFWLYEISDASDIRLNWTGVPSKNIKVGNWVLLGQDPYPGAASQGDESFSWYRVSGVSEQESVNGQIFQNLQLQGPKWNTALDTAVTWMPSVVAVYTREVMIDQGN